MSEKKALISNLDKLEEDRAQGQILKGALSVDFDGEGLTDEDTDEDTEEHTNEQEENVANV